jgi:hypothetical protein
MASLLGRRGVAFADLERFLYIAIVYLKKCNISQGYLVVLVDWNVLFVGYTGWRVFSAHMMGGACGMYE